MTDYYVDTAVGNDGNAGTSEGAGNAWATIQKAADTMVAGDLVYVKASGNYNETVTETTSGDSTSGTIAFVGYTSTPGDNGQATIDGQSTRANCFSAAASYLVIKNFRFTGATGDATIGGGSYTAFQNCRFDNAGIYGADFGSGLVFYDCTFDTLGDSAIDTSTHLVVARCLFHGNGDFDIQAGLGTACYNSVFYDLNASDPAIRMGQAGQAALVANNTIDGDNGTPNGIQSSGATQAVVILNNAIYDCNNGFVGNATAAERRGVFADYNGLASNTTDYSNFDAGSNDVTQAGDPFTNSAGRDYTLDATGGANFINAGTDYAGSVGMDIGAHQSTDAGGSGGILVHPGMSGGIRG